MHYSTKQFWLAVLATVIYGWLSMGAAIAEDFLDADQAFKLKAALADSKTLALDWSIAPGYKLYRDRLNIVADGKETRLGAPVLPDGIKSFDENFGKDVEIYHDQLAVAVSVIKAKAPFTLTVEYQGCAEAGLCYPPITRKYFADPAHPGVLKQVTEAPVEPAAAVPVSVESSATTTPPAAEDDGNLAQRTLRSGSLAGIGLAFLTFGFLLSLTPCVLPMVPILSSIIVGQGNVTRRHGLALALAYSLGMALVYTSLGVAAGLAGEGLAGALQKPWVLATFALLLFGLALSMFDVYQLQLPSALQTRLSAASDRMHGGRYTGVFAMGAISALIVGPCVAAPLAGALVYISQTHDVFLGGWALFSMAMGMSVPLLLTGLSAGSLLPHVGAWMNEVKHAFGLMLIGVAIWMIAPILPGWGALMAWGGFALLCAVFLRVFDPMPAQAGVGARFVKAAGLIFLIIGAFELLGAASGGRDVLQPLGHISVASSSAAAERGAEFKRVRNLPELERTLQSTKTPVLLDFYADWCVACKEMERYTFSNLQVANQLRNVTLLQVDVTANSEEDRALMKKFNLFGPPGIILFGVDGKEIQNSRIVGFKEAAPFLTHIKRHLGGVTS